MGTSIANADSGLETLIPSLSTTVGGDDFRITSKKTPTVSVIGKHMDTTAHCAVITTGFIALL